MKKKVILVILLLAAAMFIITSCAKKNAVGPDNANLPEVNLPLNFSNPVRIDSSRAAEPADTVKQPATLFRPYTSFPTGWKLPFCGSWQISCGYGGSQYHQGNDFYAVDWNLSGESDNGQAIAAPAAGIVRASYWDNCAGNVIVVDAGDGWLYRIMHMKNRYVSVGNWVNVGSYLGQCGNTGSCCQGSHIHFAVYYPAQWAGYIKPIGCNQWGHGISVPQNGISGQWDLRVGSYYPSYQSCQCGG